MTIREFQETIEFNIEHNLKHSILGLGAPGVGKSQIIRRIGKKYGFKVIDIRLAQMSEVEIGGLIYPNETRTKTVRKRYGSRPRFCRTKRGTAKKRYCCWTRSLPVPNACRWRPIS